MGIYKRITAILLCAAMCIGLISSAMASVYGNDTEAETNTDTYTMLQSGNLPGYYVRDMNGEPKPDFDTIKLVDNAQNDNCTKWKIVRGLSAAGSDEEDYVSFESVNFQGYYLKQSDNDSRKLSLAKLPEDVSEEERVAFSRKATFLRESGLVPKSDGETYSFSLYGSEPKVYIRHANFTVYLDSVLNSEGYINEGTGKDATFYLRESVEDGKGIYQLNAAHYGKNYFLRHLGIPLVERGKIQIRIWDGRYDTDWENGHGQWKLVQGLADSGENYVSFESKLRPGCYLKKEDGGDYVEVASLDGAADLEAFKRNATFLREEALIDPNTLTNKEITDLSMPVVPGEWHSYSLYRQEESEPKRYLRHSNYVMYVQQENGWNEGAKGTAVFRENSDHRVVISKETSGDATIESIDIRDVNGNEVLPGSRFPAKTRLYVTVTPKEGYEVTRIGVGCESYVPDRGYEDIVNGGYLIMPNTDTALTVYTEKFIPQPDAFNHPGVAVNAEWLENMKAHIEAGDQMWVDEFNLLKSLGHASKEPRILWGDAYGQSPFGSGYLDLDDSERMQVVFDATTAYVQTLMWYITDEEVYRKNALKIFDCYSRTNSMLIYVQDDRIRVSLAVAKFAVAAEILRYSEFNGSDELRWQDKHTAGFTRYLQLMRPRYDRYWHYMNQQNFCTAATAAAAIFRNDVDLYNKAIQRITTNPERCDKGALCDRNALGNDRCYSHANSGDIISQIREVTVNQLTGEQVEPNLQLIELGRDVGHAYCDVGYFSYLAFTALIQETKVNNDPKSEQYGQASDADDAVNLFEFAGHRILKGTNYMVKYTLGYDTLYVPSLVGGDYRNPTIFKQVSDERGGPENEYWNRFDAVCTGIYNYYRYYDEGKAAVENGEVTEEDMKYLEQAVIRLHPESLDADNFIGFGTLLYSGADPKDCDAIVEKEFPALQNATLDSANPDVKFDDDNYLYVGGSYNTYVQFDLSQIEEQDMGGLTTLGLEVCHSDKEPGQDVMVEIKLYTGEWKQSETTYNSMQTDLREITDIKLPKPMYLRSNSFDSRHLLQDVVSDLKKNDKYKNSKITFCLRQVNADDSVQADKTACAKVMSLDGTDNSHARPRLVTHKLVDAKEIAPTEDEKWNEPGRRLFTEKTNVKDFGYVISDKEDAAYTLTKYADSGNDVYLENLPQWDTAIYYLGEGDLTDLKKICYWVSHNRERDITLYYTRADDDFLKTVKRDFALGAGVSEDSFSIKRYFTDRKSMNKFIEQISGNVLATGKTVNTGWKFDDRAKLELTLADNVPQGRYKVFMETMSGNHAYIQFEYGKGWNVGFNKSTKSVQITAVDLPPRTDYGLTVYAAVYEKDGSGGECLKEVKMKNMAVEKGQESYAVSFSELSDFAAGDEVKVFLWDENQRPARVNEYTCLD